MCFLEHSLLCFCPYGTAGSCFASGSSSRENLSVPWCLRPVDRSLFLSSVSVEVDSSFLTISALPADALWSCCRFPVVAVEGKAGVPHQAFRLAFACSAKVASPAFREDGMRVFPPASCLEGEAGNLRPIIPQTQILSRFWYIPEQVQGHRNVQLKQMW